MIAKAMKNDYPHFEISESLRRKMVEVARQFRKEPTPSEALLWRALRGKQVDGVKFRRQQPVGPFVVDFYASDYRLVVEVDGPIHDYQIDADNERQKILEILGLKVVRVSAGQVENDLQFAIEKIREAVKNTSSPYHPISPLPDGERGSGTNGASPLSPRWGEGPGVRGHRS